MKPKNTLLKIAAATAFLLVAAAPATADEAELLRSGELCYTGEQRTTTNCVTLVCATDDDSEVGATCTLIQRPYVE